MRFTAVRLLAVMLAAVLTGSAACRAELTVGFAATDITPELSDDKPVWLAGYGQNRRATGVHDPLYARALVLDDGQSRVALVSVDLVGLQLHTVQEIRRRLGDDYRYVLVASTHNHEGPDVIGIWGPSPFVSGVDADYLQSVVERTVEAVKQAYQSRAAARAQFGTAEDESLVEDTRLPIVKDGVLRVVRFEHADSSGPLGLVVQWNSHPESLGSRNRLITCDFPYATIAALEARHGCPVAYFTGAVGGLMAPPGDRYLDRDVPLREGTFAYAEEHGREIAALANRALEASQPIELTPFKVAALPVAVPLENPLYLTAQALGVLPRGGRRWTGNYRELGPPLAGPSANQPVAAETEVACLQLGELHLACIPGELYPEFVYGKFADGPVEGVDFPDAPLEKSVAELLPSQRWLLFGLANDEIGYIIPRRQWDQAPPYAYGKARPQYGEGNSCGPAVAPIVMQALADCVHQLEAPQPGD